MIKKSIDDVLKNGAVQEYKIGTRTAKKYTLAELTQLRIEYQSLVNLEKNEQSMANGQGSYRKVLLRFK